MTLNYSRKPARRSGPALLFLGATLVCSLAIPQANSAGIYLTQEPVVITGSGKRAAEERRVSGFHAVQLGGTGQLVLNQGDREALRVEADEQVLPYLDSSVKEGRLSLGLKTGKSLRLQNIGPIVFHLTVKNLDELNLSGASTGEVGALKTAALSLSLAGASKLKLNQLEAGELKVDISGASKLEMSGNCKRQTISLSGASQYNAENLNGQEAALQLSGASKAVVAVREKLDATATGASRVEYLGSPAVTRQVSGLSAVKPRE